MKLGKLKNVVSGWALVLATAGAIAAAPPVGGGLFPAPGTEGPKEPLEIVADRLVSNNNEKYAEFSGSVKAVQGKFSVTSDTLRVYYEGDLANPSQGKNEGKGKDAIKKIVATGKVVIVTEQYTAESQRAEYLLETDVLTLTGPGSRVASGQNTITGSKIVLNRGEGKALVESGGAERVKAVLHQDQEEKEGGLPKPKKPAAPKN
jgi:lipopolysaccharide export system protein LptA